MIAACTLCSDAWHSLGAGDKISECRLLLLFCVLPFWHRLWSASHSNTGSKSSQTLGGGLGADSPLAAFCWPHQSGPVEHTPWFYTASLDVTWPPIAALCMAGMSPLWDLIAHPSYVVDTLLFEHHNVSASICISQSRAGAAVTIWNHCGVPQLMKLPRPRKPNEGSLHPLASPQLVWRCFPSSQAGPPSLARPQPAQKKPESTT